MHVCTGVAERVRGGDGALYRQQFANALRQTHPGLELAPLGALGGGEAIAEKGRACKHHLSL